MIGKNSSLVSKRATRIKISFFVIFLLTLTLGFLLQKEIVTELYHKTGFFLIFFGFLYWITILFSKPNPSIRRTILFLKKQKFVIITIIGLAILGLMASPPKFRVLADETNLLGMSLSMYLDRSFYNPTEGYFYYNEFHILHQEWDKRPNLYPFLIFLFHSILGYSAYHGFYVNFLLGGISLFVFYLLLRRIFDSAIAVSGMIWLIAYPLFLICMTSSGFEITNLCFGLICFYYFDRYLMSQTSANFEKLFLSLALTANVRYESILFAIVILPFVFLHLNKNRIGAIRYRTLLIPFLFLPIAWLHSIGINLEITSQQSGFSLEYFLGNLKSFFLFLSSSESKYGTIAPIFFFSFLGLFSILFLFYKNHKTISRKIYSFSLATFFLFIGYAVLNFSYYWGNLTQPYAIRLGLIFIPFVIVAFLFIFKIPIIERIIPKNFIIILSLFSVIFYWPVAGRNQSINELTLHRSYNFTIDYLEKHFPNRNNLIISDRPGLYSVHLWGSVGFDFTNQNFASVKEMFRNRLFENILVIQEIEYTTKAPASNTRLNEEVELEVLQEFQQSGNTMFRISKMKK